MAQLDRLIDVLAERNVPVAALRPGRPVMLDKGGGETEPLGNRELSARQIKKLLYEVISEDRMEELRRAGRLEVEYERADTAAEITALRRSGKLSVYVSVSDTEDGRDEPRREAQPGVANDSSGRPPEPSTEPSPDDYDLEIDEDRRIEESSFADATARPTGTELELGKEVDDIDERRVPMKEPGAEAAIDRYLRVMAERDCSDLHLTSGNPPLYRKDGEITHLDDMARLEPAEVEELLLPIIPDRNYEEFLEIRDTDFAYEIPGVGRFRCNIFMDRVGPGAVFRLIPDELMTAEDLGLSDAILDLCELNKGLVLVTGPTGSGKSTTLAAMIDYINRKRTAHLITLEDPIEFVHENKNCLINQREIGVHTMGFQNAIRAALREDPDIVLVGELRDLETIELAMETAETGHVVFGTLHTNTAPSTVDRIIDQFPSDRQAQIRTMLAESLRGVIAQTLCKRKEGGRVAAMEVLLANRAVSNLIRENKTFQIPNMMETNKDSGMVKLNTALMELVDNDVVTPEEAYFNAVDKDSFGKRLQAAGHTPPTGEDRHA